MEETREIQKRMKDAFGIQPKNKVQHQIACSLSENALSMQESFWWNDSNEYNDTRDISGGHRPVRRRERHLRLLQEVDGGDAEGAARLLFEEPSTEDQPASRTRRRQPRATLESVAQFIQQVKVKRAARALGDK